MKRLDEHQIEPSEDDGDVLTTVGGVSRWAPPAGSLDVEDEGVSEATDVRVLNFTGAGVTATDAGGGVVDVDIPGGGTPTFVGCKAVRTATQSLTNNTNTAVAFNATDEYDTNSLHDPSSSNTRITVPAGMGGRWHFTYSVEFASNATGLRSAFLSIDGTPKVPDGTQRFNPVSGETTRMTASADLNLTAGQYVELFVRHTITGGGALDLSTAVMSAHYLG